jgi:transcriptional regulator of heat shock response
MEEEKGQKEELKRQEEDRKREEEARLKRRDKRERVIDELIQTEREYLNGLYLCIETFINPTREKVTHIQLKLGHAYLTLFCYFPFILRLL